MLQDTRNLEALLEVLDLCPCSKFQVKGPAAEKGEGASVPQFKEAIDVILEPAVGRRKVSARASKCGVRDSQ